MDERHSVRIFDRRHAYRCAHGPDGKAVILGVGGEEISRAVRECGLSGRPLCVHSSLRSFGPPTPDADVVIDALLDEGGTVMVYTGSHQEFGLPPREGLDPPRNGTDTADRSWWPDVHGRIFNPSSNALNDGIGALPTTVLRRSGRVRGDHPIASFSAIGPLAPDLLSAQSWTDVYAPVDALADLGGDVLLIGVGLTRMTLLHNAEKRAGRNLFRRWVNTRTGGTTLVETGGCSEGFDTFEPVLAPIERTHSVGESRWKIYPAAEALARATTAIIENPSITHCGQACLRCDDAVAGGPIL